MMSLWTVYILWTQKLLLNIKKKRKLIEMSTLKFFFLNKIIRGRVTQIKNKWCKDDGPNAFKILIKFSEQKKYSNKLTTTLQILNPNKFEHMALELLFIIENRGICKYIPSV